MITEKRKRFKRISEKRLLKIEEDFRLLSNLSNTSIYEYTNKDIDEIIQRIDKNYEEFKNSFRRKTPHKKFSLK